MKYVVLILFILTSKSIYSEEIALNNKNIRLFNSDIEISKILVRVFENSDFKDFSYEKISHLHSKFKKTRALGKYNFSLELISKVNKTKKKSDLLKNCLKLQEIENKKTFRYHLAAHCFDKIFSLDMKQEQFFKLLSLNPMIKDNYKKKIDSYYSKNKLSDLESITESKQKDIDKSFSKMIKDIRKVSHTDQKDTKVFSKLMSDFYKDLYQKTTNEMNLYIDDLGYLVKTLNRHNKEDEARKICEHVLKTSNLAHENFYFELLWTYVSRSDYKKAISNVIKKYKLNLDYKTFNDTKLIFWIAHTIEVNKKGDASEIYEYLVNKHALSFYALVAYNKIKQNSKTSLVNKSKQKMEDLKLNLNEDDKQHLSLIRSLIYSKSISLLSDEIDNLLSKSTSKIDKEDLYICVSNFMQQNNNYLESFKILYSGISKDIISINESVLKLLYPRPYLDIISKQSKEFDSYLALALMRQESSFNRNANSRVGAIGLMQLMPSTAKGLKRDIKNKDLLNPQTNIKLGVEYLNNLTKRFEKNFVHTLSAYNAGERNVQYWKKNYFISDSQLKNIENIPFEETQKYVKLIFRNIFYYNYIDKLEGREPATETSRLFEKYLQVTH